MEDATPISSSPKRVLVVAYYWPPAGGPGVQRWLKFTKYLAKFGWEPVLMVPEGAAYPVMDTTLNGDVPDGTEVHRVPIFEPYEAFMRLFKGKQSAERLGSVQGSDGGLKQFLLMWLRGNLLLPDPRILWRRRAVRSAQSLIESKYSKGQPIHAVVTTGPPHSVHLIGLNLKRRTGLPWLADFRDLWRELDYLSDFHPTRRTQRRHHEMEQAVVREADRITYTSPSVLESLAPHEGTKSKFTLIYNGWDPDDVSRETMSSTYRNREEQDIFHLGHFGSLFPTRDAPALWQAIRNWNDATPKGRPRLHLDIVGNVSPPVMCSLKEHLLPSDWTFHGYIPHGAAVQMMEKMDALLLIQNNNDTGRKAIPGKAFEYLATGRPIGVVAPMPSDLGKLAEDWGLQPCGHSDIQAANAMLENLMDNAGCDQDLQELYSRPALTAQLAKVLDAMTTQSVK